MIIQSSLHVGNPEHAAKVMAEIWKGAAVPCPARSEAWITIAGDSHGSMITFVCNDCASGFSEKTADPLVASFDRRSIDPPLLISAALPAELIEAVGKREGWRTSRATRGSDPEAFDVIEFWIENTTMIELLTPDMQVRHDIRSRFGLLRTIKAFVAGAHASRSIKDPRTRVTRLEETLSDETIRDSRRQSDQAREAEESLRLLEAFVKVKDARARAEIVAMVEAAMVDSWLAAVHKGRKFSWP